MHPIEAKNIKNTILVVDDVAANLRLITNILTRQGYEVRPVPSGKLALKLVETVKPDLILLDINMPNMNGYQVCKQLKTNEKTRDIPVIFVSALGEVWDKVAAFEAGGVDYITKPFQFQEVVARIETHLSLRLLQQKLQLTVQELSHSNQALILSNKELDAFGRTVAHDLKNPLGIILAYLELLQQDLGDNPTITESTQEMVGNIQRAALRSVNIVDELLLLAGVRKSKVNLKPMEMAQVVAQVQERLEPLLKQHQAELLLPESWPTALGHAPWLEEVWINYLTNGLKYGGNPPRLELGATAQANHMIRFWVRDNGPGLTLAEQEIIFTEFTRLNEWRVEGHGLGLSIVKRIIEKLNGQVGVDSQVGQGSEFYFILPKAKNIDILQTTEGVTDGK